MPPRPFVNDALWRCLCPGFPSNASLLNIGRSSLLLQRNGSRRCAPPRTSTCLSRAYNTSSPASTASDSFFKQPGVGSSFQSFDAQSRRPPSSRKSGAKPPLATLPTHVLYEHARAEGAKGHFDEVMSICRVLVKDRGEAPNKDMYTALLHSFVSASNGTAGKVRKVLEEMGFMEEKDAFSSRQARIELDARGCECVLEVLAVHPDSLLRAEILDYMKSRWFTLSDRGHNFVVAGMLRERHFEHALEMLEDMIRRQVRVESWLFDQTMWMLLEYGEVEEAFYALNLKIGVQDKNATGSVRLSDALWGALLDAAAHKQLHEATKMIWTTQVQPGYLKPATGACLSVLILASRYGDVPLATEVFRLLTERETTLTTHHYELLITTYLKADDLSAALSAILIMIDANLKVNAGTCHPLYLYMSTDTASGESRSMRAFTLLQEFEAAGRKVPTAAVNACIQASITLNHFEEAIEIYKALHTVAHAGPDTQTFNHLFRGCRQEARRELAMYFAKEMIQLGLKPDQLTYDRLIIVCINSGDLEDALAYYEELRTIGSSSNGKKIMGPRRGTWELLIHRCVVEGDERAVALLKDYKEGVEEPRKRVEKAVLDRFQYGKVSAEAEFQDVSEELRSQGTADAT